MESRVHIEKSMIMVVDDQPRQLHALFTALQNKGCHLLIAQSGAEALTLLDRVKPDMILLDVTLPDLDGFEVCRRMKQINGARDIPVLFITASSELVDKLQGLRSGGADYITKPFQLEEVLARVEAHLTIRRLQFDLQSEKERFKELADAAFEGILLHEKGKIIDANQPLERMLGYSREELLAKKLPDLFAPESKDVAAALTDPETECIQEALAVRKDGGAIPLEVQGRAVRHQDREIRVAAMRDISWRKTLEAQTLQLESENIILKASLQERDRLGELVGRAPVMQKMYERLLKAAMSDAPVIIYGETGSGKELAARTIWQLSEKYTAVFIPVNCAALQETLFESQFFGHRKGAFTGATQDQPGYFDQARGGVLFLDEISELNSSMQAKLLRALNDGEYTPVGDAMPRMADTRIICASNQPLRNLVAAGRFREDLFYRLHIITLDMPPLRRHKEDLPLLTDHFLRQMTPAETGPRALPARILTRFGEYDWPGNVRELANEVRRYVSMNEVELGTPVPQGEAALIRGQTLTGRLEAFERQVIADALSAADGNRNKASELLQIPLPSLYRKIQKYRL
jgi:PAS domain S-box-containing protein